MSLKGAVASWGVHWPDHPECQGWDDQVWEKPKSHRGEGVYCSGRFRNWFTADITELLQEWKIMNVVTVSPPWLQPYTCCMFSWLHIQMYVIWALRHGSVFPKHLLMVCMYIVPHPPGHQPWYWCSEEDCRGKAAEWSVWTTDWELHLWTKSVHCNRSHCRKQVRRKTTAALMRVWAKSVCEWTINKSHLPEWKKQV